MTEYICVHYVKTPEGMYAPGTTIDVSGMTKNQIDRLLTSGAIRAVETLNTIDIDETPDMPENIEEAKTETDDNANDAETDISDAETDAETAIAAEDLITTKAAKRGKK